MNITVRNAIPTDFPTILSLIKEFAAFQQTSEKVMVTLGQMEKEKDLIRCIVAETSDHIMIGFASFFFAYYSWSGKALYLDDLYVAEHYRGQKAGTLLLNEIIKLGKRERCKKIRWQVSRWNTSAIGFYRKMGADIDDVEINCDLYL